MITEKLLNDKATFFTQFLWNKKLTIPIRINNRLKATLGQYCKDKIDLSKRIIHDELLTDDTLLHELCHWYCDEIGEDNRDHTKFFEEELKRIGASSTYTSDYKNGKWYHLYNYGCYRCNECGRKLETKDYLDEKQKGEIGAPIKKYYCCDSKMYYSGRKIVPEDFVENEKLKQIRNAFKENSQKHVEVVQ
ncbi:SprT-like domain-containing protein [Paenibacillus sp. GCM10027627]|uniref:SprT-like domain-containing protein n=1 Tax=unclassified Paenibacillus TaxID=185978 RepID=UPI0036327CF6